MVAGQRKNRRARTEAGRAILHEGSQPEGYYPWYEIPGRASAGMNIIFGHWSTLRSTAVPGIYPTDSGCLWGGELTALRIDTGPERIDLPCRGWQKPKAG